MIQQTNSSNEINQDMLTHVFQMAMGKTLVNKWTSIWNLQNGLQ